jgi:hypothetical protein
MKKKDINSIFIVFIITFVTIASITQLQKQEIKADVKIEQKKEFEFIGVKLIEVDTIDVKSITNATSMYKTKKGFILEDMVFVDNNIKLLKAKKALYFDNTMYLYDNIEFYKSDGFVYYTDRAIYDKKVEILKINDKFKALRDRDTFYGNNMIYDLKTKIVNASNADSRFVLN